MGDLANVKRRCFTKAQKISILNELSISGISLSAHVLDRFPPEQIPKLTGLEYSWGKLTSTQIRSLNANQARNLRKHIIDNDKKDILKEQLEIVEQIIDNDLKKKGKK